MNQLKRFQKIIICSILGISMMGSLFADGVPASAGDFDAFSHAQLSSLHVSDSSENYVDGEVIVTLADDDLSTSEVTRSLRKEVSDLTVSDYETCADTPTVLAASDSEDTESLINELSDLDVVANVEPNYIFSAASLTNDTYVDYQWYLEDNSDSNSDISYSSVTGLTPVTTPVVIVADTGIDSTQEDLKSSMYSNTMYDCFSKTDVPASDSDGHGTHIAGLIAATTNNNTGIAGISSAKIMAVKCLDNDGNGTVNSVLEAMRYAIRQKQAGVNICAINLSFCAEGSSFESLNKLITEAGKLGIVTVTAAGNESQNVDTTQIFPAALDNPYLITVGASNRDNEPASFSNYGQKNVDVFAPGVDMFSTYTDDYYLPESNHEIFYEDFENYDTTQLTSSASNTTAGIRADGVESNSHSLCWTVTTTPYTKYKLNIPYTVSETVTTDSYVGMYFKIQSKTTNAKGTIGITDLAADTSNTAANTFATFQDVTYDYTVTPDYWNQVAFAEDTASNNKAAGDAYIQLTLTSKTAATYEIYIDNLGSGTQTSPYTYELGTSMACPLAVGEIAFLASVYPDMSTEERIARVIGGVDTSDSYAGKCTSGGKLNIGKAVSSPNPYLTSVTQDGNKVTIDGYFLGSTPGTLTLTNATGSTAVATDSWSDKQITFTSDALPSGTYTITVTRADGTAFYAGFTFAYTAAVYVETLSLNQKQLTLEPGKTYQLVATAQPSTASDTSVTFQSSNTKYLTVSDTGLIKATSAGNKKTVTVTCTANDRKTVTAECKVSIGQKVTKITLNKKKITLKAGKSKKLKATIAPTNAALKKVKWTSSKKKWAKVSANGKVTAKKAGKGHKVTITCTALDGSGKKAKCVVVVK